MKTSTNASPWDPLIHAHLDNVLDEAGQAEFSVLMLESAAARKRFWELAEIHSLASAAFRHESADMKLATSNRAKHKPVRWLQWRPLAQAAVGVLLGVLSTSVVLAFGYPGPVKRSLPLANPGFEPPAQLPHQLINQSTVRLTGEWVGAAAITEGNQQGIQPVEGRQMLRFKLSMLEPGKHSLKLKESEVVRSSGVLQIIDLRPWRQELANGMAMVEWSAAFNGVLEPVLRKNSYRIGIRAYVQTPDGGRTSQEPLPVPNGMTQVAYDTSWTMMDNDPSKWQRLSGHMLLPARTDFIQIALRIFQYDSSGMPIEPKDIWHFVDDVHFNLITTADDSLAAAPRP